MLQTEWRRTEIETKRKRWMAVGVERSCPSQSEEVKSHPP